MYSYLLKIFEFEDDQPEIKIQALKSRKVKTFRPVIGYDLCDFIELNRAGHEIEFNYIGNYYKGNDKEYHELEIYDISDEPITKSIASENYHPYYELLRFNDLEDKLNSGASIQSNEVKDKYRVFLAYTELSHFFDLSDIEGLTYEFFLKYIQRRILIPKFSTGPVSIFEYDFKYKDSINIDYNERLKEKRNQLTNFVDYNGATYYYCENILDIVVAYTYHILKLGYVFKQCENCGKWFVPLHRSDTKYCSRFAPQDNTKTCKKYAIDKSYNDKLKKDKVAYLYRRNYQRLSNNARKYSDVDYHVKLFTEYKELSKEYKNKYESGLIEQEEYYKWLKKYDRSRIKKEDKNE